MNMHIESENNTVVEPNNKVTFSVSKSRIKKGVFVVFLLLIIALVAIGIYPIIVSNIRKSPEGAEQRISELYNYLINDNPGIVFDNYLATDIKRQFDNKQDYIDSFADVYSNNKIKSFEVHKVIVKDDSAYIDRSVESCSNNCEQTNTIRGYKVMYWKDNNWYLSDERALCIREKPYKMEPEFSRALSLIVQRFGQSENTSFVNYSKFLDDVTNCLSIEYSEKELEGAEGVFEFVPNQNVEKLTILISPKYKSKDDLTTAILLSHETTHAMNYVAGLNSGDMIGCYDDEISAFLYQGAFMGLINEAENESVMHRINTDEELNYFGSFLIRVWEFPGDALEDKVKYFVVNNPGYQEQCKDESRPEGVPYGDSTIKPIVITDEDTTTSATQLGNLVTYEAECEAIRQANFDSFSAAVEQCTTEVCVNNMFNNTELTKNIGEEFLNSCVQNKLNGTFNN